MTVMTEMETRYSNFLNAVRKSALNGEKIVPSAICNKHKVITVAYSVIRSLGYVKDMDNVTQGLRTIVWIPTTEIKYADVTKVLTACRAEQAKAKRQSVKNLTGKGPVAKNAKVKKSTKVESKVGIDIDKIHTKLTKANVTINGTKIVVPVHKNQVNLEVGNNKITINM